MAYIRYLLTATPDGELAGQIAAFSWHGSAAIRDWVLRTAKRAGEEPSFHVVAWDEDCPGRLVGEVFCRRHPEDPCRWIYGDLAVGETFRRRGIARELLGRAVTEISARGGAMLDCYVMPENVASRALQEAMGFTPIPAEPFDALSSVPRGAVMYRLAIGEKSTNG